MINNPFKQQAKGFDNLNLNLGLCWMGGKGGRGMEGGKGFKQQAKIQHTRTQVRRQ